MLDYFCIFTKGGALLWAFQMTALKGAPVNALVRTYLLEERSGERSFTYTPPAGASYTLKWTMRNGLGLVFVAVYQKALKLLYVDELLQTVAGAFASVYVPGEQRDYKGFDDTFRQLLLQAEAQGELLSKRPANGGLAPTVKVSKGGRGGAGTRDALPQEKGSEEDGGRARRANGAANGVHDNAANSGKLTSESDSTSSEEADSGGATAFNRAAIGRKLVKRGPGAASKAPPARPAKEVGKKSRGPRKWGSAADVAALDFSGGPASGAAGVEGVDYAQRSRVDVDEDEDFQLEEEEEAAAVAGGGGAGAKAAGGGVLASFVWSLGVSVVGTSALTRDDIQAALDAMKRKLMERNVAEEIAEKLCESVAASVVGKKLGSFTRVGSVVVGAFEAALMRILTPKRSIDVLREVRAAQAKGRPYVIVFVGVNGVGKSTNLAKVAYWLQQNGASVTIAACDTFRSGAVEQLQTHCARLGVPLYEQGYEKDPARVAAGAIKAAAQAKRDVVLVDTAGRMQDNEPLMRALSSLIAANDPDLVLFVGEALVGNDAVDQLTKFKQRLADLGQGPEPHTVDGIVLTKFDTIDDKVGAALSMVYTSGAPIMFVGCGQTYVDLKKLNVKQVVRCLLK